MLSIRAFHTTDTSPARITCTRYVLYHCCISLTHLEPRQGCGSDIAIHFYSLSTDLNPDWDSNYGSQPQIQSYWKNISEKYDLDRHIIFNTVVCSAIWSPEEELYDIVTEDLITGERSTTKVKVLITALGILEVPRIPDIPGIEKFKGSMFHAGRYDSSAELSGRRVAVIGNGASA